MFSDTVDIIIPVWNQFDLTEKCLQSIKKNTKVPFRIIIIDNGSIPSVGKSFMLYKDWIIIRNETNLGFTKAINQGLKASAPDRYKVLLNNDTEVPEGWLSSMLNVIEIHPNVGMVGPMNTAFDEVQYYGTKHKMVAEIQKFNTLRMLSFFCVLIKPTVIETIGYLDENMEIFCSDDAYCKKAIDMKFNLLVDFNTTIKHWHRASSKLRKDAGKIYEKDLAYLQQNYFAAGKKIYAAVLNQGWVNARLFAQFPKYLMDQRFKFTYQISERKPITNNRNHIRTDFLETDAEILWMIDACIAPPDDILNILMYDKDIIACPCPLWSNSDQGSWISWNCGYEDGDMTVYPKQEQQVGLQPIDRIGTGCFFLKRKILEDINAPFLIDYDVNGHLVKGLDFRFCDIARSKGYEVYTHWGYQCDHKKEVWLFDVLQYGVNCVRQNEELKKCKS